MKTQVRKDHGLIRKMLDHGLEVGVMDISSGEVPTDHHTKMIEQLAELATHNPASIRETFDADLSIRPTFTNRMNQFDAITIDDTQQAWLDQKADSPVPVNLKQAKQPCSFR